MELHLKRNQNISKKLELLLLYIVIINYIFRLNISPCTVTDWPHDGASSQAVT